MNIKACFNLLTIAIALLLSGCAGFATDATNITKTGATLNATATCDTGDCGIYSEYWPADSSAEWGSSTTELHAAPPPVPFTIPNLPIPISGLQPDTEYQFRICSKEAAEPENRCSPFTESFHTLPPDEILTFSAVLEAWPNVVTLRWTTQGGTTGERLHIYGAYTDPVTGIYHRNVGYADQNNTTGLTFRVPPGTHRYVLELPTPSGKVRRTVELTVPAPTPPVVNSLASIYPKFFLETQVSWQPLPADHRVRISGPLTTEALPVGQNTYIFTPQQLNEMGAGEHLIQYRSCMIMQGLEPKMNNDFCSTWSRTTLSIGSARFLGPSRQHKATNDSVTVSWEATGDTSVLHAPPALGGDIPVGSATSYTFDNLPDGIHDIGVESCLSSPVADCANTDPVTTSEAGTLIYVAPPALIPVGQEIARIQTANDVVGVYAHVAGAIRNHLPIGTEVSAGDTILELQTRVFPSIRIIVSSDPFELRHWNLDFDQSFFGRHDLPQTTHVGLGFTMPLRITNDKTIWSAGEFAEGSIVHITGQPGGNYGIYPLAAPVLNKSNGDRLVPVSPFSSTLGANFSVTKQETLIEVGPYIWFINGGVSRATPEQLNWNRIIRFNRAGIDFAATQFDDRFCVFHVPFEGAGVMGIDWDEENNQIWFVESRATRKTPPHLSWFKPDELTCENDLDYSAPKVAVEAETDTNYCANESDTHCIHTIELSDSAAPERQLYIPAHVKVESDAVWVAGFASSSIARYDIASSQVDILNVSPSSGSTNFYGTGPWQFITTPDYVYFSEFFDGDVVKLDKQSFAADPASCKNVDRGINPCMDEIHASRGIKEIALYGNRLYFGGAYEFGYINYDTWTPGVIYTGLSQMRNTVSAQTTPFISGDLSVGPDGMAAINDYFGRSVFRFYPIAP